MTTHHLPTSPGSAPGDAPSPHEAAPKSLSESHIIRGGHPSSEQAQNASRGAWDGYHQAPGAPPKPCHELTVTRSCDEDTGEPAAGVECSGMEEAQSMELWVRHMTRIMEVSSVQRQTQRTHDTNNTATLPSVAPLPFLSGISKPVPPEGYRETSVGTGQLLAVSSVISYICPSIGCRCQFRPNRCMAVVSNEKSHLFLLEVEMKLPSHGGVGGEAGVGRTTGIQVSSVQQAATEES